MIVVRQETREGAGCRIGVPYGIVIIYESLQTLTRLSIPEPSTGGTEQIFKFIYHRQLLHQAIHGTRNDQCPIQVKANCGDGVRVGGKDFEGLS